MIRLAIYFAVTFAVTWSFWIVAANLTRDLAPGAAPGPGLWTLFLYLGTFTPAFVALFLTATAEGLAGLRALVGRLFQWRVGWWPYVFALGFTVAIKLAAALAHRLILGQWPAFGPTPLPLMLIGAVVSVLIGGQTGEEIGWRGYALPRLSAGIGLGPASLLLGVVWAVWHLPLFFFFPFADTHGQSFPLYLVQVAALSVAIGWLWWRSGGSLLLTMLLHSAINNTKDIVPSGVAGASDPWALSGSAIGWMTVVLLWVAAAYFLVRMGGRRTPLAT